jgi:hypothetical protein
VVVSTKSKARATRPDGRARAASSDLKAIAQQADSQGRRYISVAASELLGEAMLADKQYAPARQQLQGVVGRSEKLGTRLITTRAHYSLGAIARLTGDSTEAKNQYMQAKTLLDEIAKEPGAEHVPDRYDLKPAYAGIQQFTKN